MTTSQFHLQLSILQRQVRTVVRLKPLNESMVKTNSHQPFATFAVRGFKDARRGYVIRFPPGRIPGPGRLFCRSFEVPRICTVHQSHQSHHLERRQKKMMLGRRNNSCMIVQIVAKRTMASCVFSGMRLKSICRTISCPCQRKRPTYLASIFKFADSPQRSLTLFKHREIFCM